MLIVYVPVCVRARARLCVVVCVRARVCGRVRVCARACLWLCVPMCACVRASVCACVCVCVYGVYMCVSPRTVQLTDRYELNVPSTP